LSPSGSSISSVADHSRDGLMEKYQGRVEFLFVYCQEAHPEGEGDMCVRSMTPALEDLPPLTRTRSWEERAERARLFRDWTKTPRRILVDEDGPESVSARYGGFGDRLIVVDTQGRIAWRSGGLTGQLDQVLADLLATDVR
jgi:hypothetical protein